MPSKEETFLMMLMQAHCLRSASTSARKTDKCLSKPQMITRLLFSSNSGHTRSFETRTKSKVITQMLDTTGAQVEVPHKDRHSCGCAVTLLNSNFQTLWQDTDGRLTNQTIHTHLFQISRR